MRAVGRSTEEQLCSYCFTVSKCTFLLNKPKFFCLKMFTDYKNLKSLDTEQAGIARKLMPQELPSTNEGQS